MTPPSFRRLALTSFILPSFAYTLYSFREFARQGDNLHMILGLASGAVTMCLAASVVVSINQGLDRCNGAALSRHPL